MEIDRPALAYFPDPGDLDRIFGDWPDDMAAAVYLDPAGTCALVPFAPGEPVETRLRRMFGAQALRVFPARPGEAELPLLYSEEQRLLAMLAGLDAGRVRDTMRDFALNARFAAEEGMDPGGLAGDVHILLAGPAPRPAPPLPPAPLPGVIAPVPAAPLCRSFGGAILRDAAGGLAICPEGATGAPLAVPAPMLVRGDLHGLVLQLDCAADGGRVLCLPAGAVPDAVLPPGVPMRAVALTQVETVLFLTFPEPVPVPARAPAPKPAVAMPPRRGTRPARRDRAAAGLPPLRQRLMMLTERQTRLRRRRFRALATGLTLAVLTGWGSVVLALT